MRYAAKYITSANDHVVLMIGVDTGVFHGFVNCGASGAITGIGCVLPAAVIALRNLSIAAAKGDFEGPHARPGTGSNARRLSSFIEGTDLVFYFNNMLFLKGETEYELHFNETEELSLSQRGYVAARFKLFNDWYAC